MVKEWKTKEKFIQNERKKEWKKNPKDKEEEINSQLW